MKILKARAYSGPNLVAAFPLVHLALLVEGPQNWPGDAEDPEITDSLIALLPGLAEHPDKSNQPGGFVAELRGGSDLPLGYVVARVATELLRDGTQSVGLAGVTRRAEGALQDAFFLYEDADIAVQAGHTAVLLVLALLPARLRPRSAFPPNINAGETLAAFARWLGTAALDQTAMALIREARRRDIPWFVLDRRRRIVQLGQGCKLRRIRETVTDATPAITTWIQADKSTTNRLLAGLHFPVPKQARVSDAEAAVSAAQKVGYPVAVKPLDSGKGRGISLMVSDDDAVRAAFAIARRYSAHVIIENHIVGADYRVLIVDGRMRAAAKRLPAAVTGDGQRTIADLVAEVNKDPRRGVGFSRLMNRIELDAQSDALLTKQGHSRKSVPKHGELVLLRETANISTGGTAVDVTDVVHPENRWMLERAVRVTGADIAGVDFLSPDISRSYREAGGAICEINASPGLRPHQIAEGPPRDVVGPIVDMLFPEKGNGRIPIAAITGTNGKTTTSRMLAHILRSAGDAIGIKTVGLVTTDGVHVDDQLVGKGDFAGGTGARVLLRDPSVEAAVLETARGGIVKSGLAFEHCDVAAFLNVATDHIGLDGIGSLDEMAVVKGRVIEAARGLAVLNAEDPRCLAMAAQKEPQQVCLFSAAELTAEQREHLSRGGLAVSLAGDPDDQIIVLHHRDGTEEIAPVGRIPATLGGAARHNVLNAQAAAALAYGLGIPCARIGEALSSFESSFDRNPGRLNVFEGHPFKVVMDFAHNPDCVRVICDMVKRMKVDGRRICMLGSTGHRQGEHIGEVCELVAQRFDSFICTRNKRVSEERQSTRGFPGEEIPHRLAAALMENGVDASRIVTIDDDNEAVDRGLTMSREGDLLVLLLNNREWAWERIRGFQAKDAE